MATNTTAVAALTSIPGLQSILQLLFEPKSSSASSSIWMSTGYLTAGFAVALGLLYQLLRPKIIPGIPYNRSIAYSIFGDIPAVIRYTTTKDGIGGWFREQVEKHNSPLVQVFIRPFGRPVVLLADFRESQDIMIRRKEFDRAGFIKDLLSPLSPNHHIAMSTNNVWKAHRRLLQDLMMPAFLNTVAAPNIYASAERFIELWNIKMRLADGRPFPAFLDLHYGALDAVLAFSFGLSFPHCTVLPQIELLSSLSSDEVAKLHQQQQQTSLHGDRRDEAIDFPKAPIDDTLTASMNIIHIIDDMQKVPLPGLWYSVMSKRPYYQKYLRDRDRYLQEEVEKAVQRLQVSGGDDSWVRSAVDHVVMRENLLAEKDGREPEYWTPAMHDEVYGFVVAGHETSSSTLSWGLKLLTDNPTIQTRLRSELQAALATAVADGGRAPSVTEISQTNIPYLDATLEEILRCSTTSPNVWREATRETQVLGCTIPKGTSIAMLTNSASILSPAFDIDERLRNATSQAQQKSTNNNNNNNNNKDDLAAFEPARWLRPSPSGEKNESEFDPMACPQMPFGLGLRGCYGRRLAYLEMRILLTLIIWNFELEQSPPGLSGYTAVDGLTHKPVQFYMRLRKVVF